MTEIPAGLWMPDLATPEGRLALNARIAKAPAVLLRSEEAQSEFGLEPSEIVAALPLARPRLWVAVATPSRQVIVRLTHLCRPYANAAVVLRKRLAEIRFEEPAGDRAEEVAWAWGMLCREHELRDVEHMADGQRARSLARALRHDGPPR